jgi:hypothetical protein
MKKNNFASRVLKIYFNKEETSFQVIKPGESFNPKNDDIEWKKLAVGVTNGLYDHYEVY